MFVLLVDLVAAAVEELPLEDGQEPLPVLVLEHLVKQDALILVVVEVVEHKLEPLLQIILVLMEDQAELVDQVLY